MGETAKRLQEIIDACRGGARTTCGGELCGECIECSARAAKVSLQREMALLRTPRGEGESARRALVADTEVSDGE